MRWRIALTSVGSLLLAAAATVASLQVHVGGSGESGRSCGSALDVVTDRTGWEVWYAQDSLDASALVRTLRCPDAVNAHTIVAGALGAAGLAALLAGIALRRTRATAWATNVVRLRRLGAAVTAVGSALTIGGLCALGLLLANRDATLFLYVRRPLVAAIGVVVLAPVLALVAGGRALMLLSRALQDREADDEAT